MLAKLTQLFQTPPVETESMRLSDAPLNTPLIIQAMHSEEANVTLLRLGVSVGDTVTVLARVSKTGPLIIEANHSEVALGHEFGLAIEVMSL